MNIGYVKFIKNKESKNKLISLFYNTAYKIKDKINYIKQDENYKNIYYMTNNSKKSKEKMNRILNRNKIDYVINENEENIEYPTLRGYSFTQYMLPEIIEYCYKFIKTTIEEIYICTNNMNQQNIQIIKDLARKVKVVNIVTENQQFIKLEQELEKEDIFITISNNKRRALKSANIVINLDFNNFKEYNINRKMIIIDVSAKVQIPKGFSGIIIKGIEVETKKVMRIFSEFDNFNKSKLIEAEIIKIFDKKTNNFNEIREYIYSNKIYIKNCINENIISVKEFETIENSLLLNSK